MELLFKEGDLFGPYEILSLLGRGGMGAVYKALHTGLERAVALKVLPPQIAVDHKSYVERFLLEAKTAAKVSHSNIVNIFDSGNISGKYFISMELIDGVDARQLLQMRKGPLSQVDAIHICLEVAKGLAAAHKRDVIHRDIKPANIMITNEPGVKLADFGLAKNVAIDSDLTVTGQLLGTPAYLSPEQAGGKKADFRSDIYSLGITLFEMLTGKRPYYSETPLGLLKQHAESPLPNPLTLRGDLHIDCKNILFRMTEKSPNKRYEDYEELISELSFLKDAVADSDGQSQYSSGKSEDVVPSTKLERKRNVAVMNGGDYKSMLIDLKKKFYSGEINKREYNAEKNELALLFKPDQSPKKAKGRGQSSKNKIALIAIPIIIILVIGVYFGLIHGNGSSALQENPEKPQLREGNTYTTPENALPVDVAGDDPSPPNNKKTKRERDLEDLLSKAEDMKRNGDYESAIDLFLKAQEIDRSSTYIKGQIDELNGLISAELAKKVKESTKLPTRLGLPPNPVRISEIHQGSGEIPPHFANRFRKSQSLKYYGGSSGVPTAVDMGLEWLARHQNGDGIWGCKTYKQQCRGSVCMGAGSSTEYDLGVSGLALLAFMADGNSPTTGKHRDTVKKGIIAVIQAQWPDGRIGPVNIDGHWIYLHAICTSALLEAYAISGMSKELLGPATKAVDFLIKCQNPGLGWRYGSQTGENDTSVTAWAVSALICARESGIDIGRSLDRIPTFLNRVTNEKGKTGYTKPGDTGARLQEAMGKFTTSEAMTSAALFLRVFTQKRDASFWNYSMLGQGLILTNRCKWDVRGGTIDMYYWYYATLALFQLGGQNWAIWNQQTQRSLLPNQEQHGCQRGSWKPIGAWGTAGGRTYSTAICVLTLQTYYRYSRYFDR